mmetsp:Transcript_3118/g.5890  ORF Transcript_3118/g.5890 Transcript_3118/m.5890 type:complete len:387 (-) Transcript_3118:553-1713(-)
MNVVFAIAGRIEVYHHLDALDVQATSSNVCSNHDWPFASPEILDGTVSCALIQVPVQRSAWYPVTVVEVLAQPCTSSLGVAEDQDQVALGTLCQDVPELHEFFLVVTADYHKLAHVGICSQLLLSQRNTIGVDQKIACQRAHLFAPRGGEHEHLPWCVHPSQDRPDLRLKAHVEHSVGLVQDNVAALREVSLAIVNEVIESARGGNNALHAATQLHKLVTARCTAIQARCVDSAWATELLCLAFYLLGKLACWSHGQDTNLPSQTVRLVHDLQKARQQERQCLATASLGHANDVTPLDGELPSVSLDGHRLGEASITHGVHDHGWEHRLARLERVHGFGHCSTRLASYRHRNSAGLHGTNDILRVHRTLSLIVLWVVVAVLKILVG